eukprot:maker-scaffold_16-snap-gene-6.23-mRNA-1 protein AED:0.05 eAED:0.06 QI:0/0/0/1/1/1/2/0/1136
MNFPKFGFKKDPWESIKTKYSPSVVCISVIYPKPFSHYVTSNESIASATGFIVDSSLGLILTNKHVVGQGPVRMTAKFLSNQELELTPLFVDPVHDFAFVFYDPAKLTANKKIISIPLFPNAASSSDKILIMGNNGGERLTFVESVIGQTKKTIDHPLCYNTFFFSATDLTVGGSSGGPVINSNGQAVAVVSCGNIEDHSSFYLPLFRPKKILEDIQNGTRFEDIQRGSFLVSFGYKVFEELYRFGVNENKLNEIKKEVLKEIEPIVEGEIETKNEEILEFNFEYDFEGLLVVDRLLEDGVGYESGLRAGDIIVRINSVYVENYIQIEEILDKYVGKITTVDIIRPTKGIDDVEFFDLASESDEMIHLEVLVENLRSIEPKEYLEVSNAVCHELEYPLALANNLPLKGVYLNSLGYMFQELSKSVRHFGPPVILKLGHNNTFNLESFQKAIEKCPNGSRVAVKYYNIYNRTKENFAAITVDKRWYPFILAERGKKLLKSKIEKQLVLDEAPEVKGVNSSSQQLITVSKQGRRSRSFLESGNKRISKDRGTSKDFISKQFRKSSANTQIFKEKIINITIFGDKWKYRNIAQETRDNQDIIISTEKTNDKDFFDNVDPFDALGYVEFKTPFSLDATTFSRCFGVGLVVDSNLGLVICERMTVPTTLGDFYITFNASTIVRCKVLFVHPFHEFSILQYDVNKAKKSVLCFPKFLDLVSERIEDYHSLKVEYFGMTSKQDRLESFCEITKVDYLYVEPKIAKPQFVPKNVEFFSSNAPIKGVGGIYMYKEKVMGFNFYFSDQKFRGLFAADVFPFLQQIRTNLLENKNKLTKIHLLPVQFNRLTLVQAISVQHLDDEWAAKVLKSMGRYSRSLLTISRIMSPSDASSKLLENDILLAIDDEVTTSFFKVQKKCSEAAFRDPKNPSVKITVLRSPSVLEFSNVSLSCLSCVGTERVVMFGGMIIQDTHPDVHFLSFNSSNKIPGIYITGISPGSPADAEAHISGVRRENSFLTRINNDPVDSLDELINCVLNMKHDDFVNITAIDLSTQAVSVYQIKLDMEFHSTRELERNESGLWVEKSVVPMKKGSNSFNMNMIEVNIDNEVIKEEKKKNQNEEKKKMKKKRSHKNILDKTSRRRNKFF